MQTRSLLSSLFVVLVPLACGADGTTEGTVSYRPDPAQCSGAWQVLFAPQQRLSVAPANVEWHRDRVYFLLSNAAEQGLRSVPAAGGPASAVSDATPWRFWVEDSGVTFASAEELKTIPLAGGLAQLALPFADWGSGEFPLIQALDTEAFYWTSNLYALTGKSGWVLHQQPRAGGPAVELTRVMGGASYGVSKIVPAGGQLVTIRYGVGPAWVVPRGGGESRPLPAGGEVVGVSADGALLWRQDGGGFDGSKGSERYAVLQSRLDGQPPRPFWTAKPPNAFPRAAWGDGRGGWYVSAWEWGIDEALHTTMWAVDHGGRGRRLACDPEVNSSVEVAAVGSDGVYAVVRYSNFSHWAIVRVAGAAETTSPPGDPPR